MSIEASTQDIASPLLTLLDLAHKARSAPTAGELAFLLVNDTRRLLRYRQAALWWSEGGVDCLSGVVQPEANAPYVQWLEKVAREQAGLAGDYLPLDVLPENLPPALAQEWADWLPAHALWIDLPASPEHQGSTRGGLLIASEEPIPVEVFELLKEWLHTWHHAWLARMKPPPWSWSLWKNRLQRWWRGNPDQSGWRSRPVWWCIGLVAVLLFPVRLSVLAPGELVPSNPAIIRAPLDGVIAQFHVRPNEVVKANQPLFSFDEAPIASRMEAAKQALSSAEAEYQQQAQLALSDAKSKGQIAVTLGKMGEKQAEAEFLASQYQRSRVLAPQDGIAIYDDPTEWVGRPVQTGERVMKIAAANDVEIEAWIPVGDAIPLDSDAPVSLYLAALPLSSLSGQVRYLGHDAQPRPDGTFAYRLRAKLSGSTDLRVGLKGTAKIQGHWVPLIYWIMRRPLATVRQWVAL
jgi:hypothetical protein